MFAISALLLFVVAIHYNHIHMPVSTINYFNRVTTWLSFGGQPQHMPTQDEELTSVKSKEELSTTASESS